MSNILADFSADVIVGDTFAFGGQFIAEAHGLPYALVNVMNMGFPSRDVAPDGLGLAPSASLMGRLRNRFLDWVLARVVFRDVNKYLMQKRATLGLAPIAESIFAVPVRADLFLQPTIPAFEYPRSDLPGHVHFIGALTPDATADFAKPSWWGELEGALPVVLVTQGTVATNLDELLIPTIRGLADENVLVIATTGNKTPASVNLKLLPNNVRLEQFVPFAHLMPYVDVMVTNGGYGGTHFRANTWCAPCRRRYIGGQSRDLCAY